MQKVLTVILIITLILCILGGPLIFNFNGSTTFKRNVNHIVNGSASVKKMFFNLEGSELTEPYTYYFRIEIDWDFNDSIVDSYNYSQAHLIYGTIEDVDDSVGIVHEFELVSMPCYYYLDYKRVESNGSITYSVSSLAIVFDFIIMLKSLSAFEKLSEIYELLDRNYNTSLDLNIEFFENFNKFFKKTDIFFKFTKWYFNFFTLKGVE